MPRAHSESTQLSVGPNFAAKRSKIIELNDQLRTTFKGGRVQMTPSVYDLDERLRGRALAVMTSTTSSTKTASMTWAFLSSLGTRSSGALSAGAPTTKVSLLILPTPQRHSGC
jgi:hypothetical protein